MLDRSTGGITLPLDAFIAQPGQLVTINRAADLLVERCMARLGFDYQIPPRPDDDTNLNAHRYGLWSASEAVEIGYETPVSRETAALQKRNSTSTSAALDAALLGKSRSRGVPKGGCSGESARRLYRGTKSGADMQYPEGLGWDAYTASRSKPLVQAAFAKWRACMSQRGYDIDDPVSGGATLFSKDNQPPPNKEFVPHPSEQEVATARADVACKRTVHLVEVWSEAEATLQVKAIAKHRAQLDASDALRDRVLRNARSVLGR